MPAISELPPIQIISNDFRSDNLDGTFFGSTRITVSRGGVSIGNIFSGSKSVLSINGDPLIRSQLGRKRISSNGGTHTDLDPDFSTITYSTGNFTNFTQQGTISGFAPIGSSESYLLSILSTNAANTISVESGRVRISASYEPRPAGATGGYGDSAVTTTETQRWF